MRVVEVSGTPHERGFAHGEQARDLIEPGVEAWRKSLRDDLETEPDAYLAEFLAQTTLVDEMQRHTPWLVDEIRGIAEGSGFPAETILAYNLTDEEWWYRQHLSIQPRGCSVIGIRKGPGGFPIAAQNVDLPDYYEGTQLVVRMRGEDGLDTMTFGFAGGTGLCGCNSEGVVVLCNALPTLRQTSDGLSVSSVLRGMLAQTTLAAVNEFAGSVVHASGQAYLVSGSGELLGLECSAAGVVEFGRNADVLWHTNHPYVSEDVNSEIDAFPILAGSDTLERGEYIAERLPEIAVREDIEAILSDRSVPVCRVPRWADDGVTLGSIMVELTSPPRVSLAPGPPDRTPFEHVAFDRRGLNS